MQLLLILCNNFVLTVSKAGLTFEAMDENGIVMAFFKLEADYFSAYNCDQHQNIGMKLETIVKFLNVSSKDGGLQVTLNDGSTKLQLNFISRF